MNITACSCPVAQFMKISMRLCRQIHFPRVSRGTVRTFGPSFLIAGAGASIKMGITPVRIIISAHVRRGGRDNNLYEQFTWPFIVVWVPPTSSHETPYFLRHEQYVYANWRTTVEHHLWLWYRQQAITDINWHQLRGSARLLQVLGWTNLSHKRFNNFPFARNVGPWPRMTMLCKRCYAIARGLQTLATAIASMSAIIFWRHIHEHKLNARMMTPAPLLQILKTPESCTVYSSRQAVCKRIIHRFMLPEIHNSRIQSEKVEGQKWRNNKSTKSSTRKAHLVIRSR